jgi:FtsH-binding integral membrane protein
MCSVTNPKVVFMAVAMTCFMTLALTVYACTTKTDFTVCNSLLFIASCVLLLFGICQIFIRSHTFQMIICCFGVFLYSIYLVYDTQLIIGTKENKLDYDDYILGALMLYLDIINLFIYLLQILREFQKD